VSGAAETAAIQRILVPKPTAAGKSDLKYRIVLNPGCERQLITVRPARPGIQAAYSAEPAAMARAASIGR
jgi:hypothetical protein